MGPNNNPFQGREKQIATLGDIQMLAQNIGQIENNYRGLVGNINDIVGWVRSIDQAAFIAIHFQVNGSLEFTEETTQKTVDFLSKGRENMQAYQVEQDAKALKEALDVMGDEFMFQGKKYRKTSEKLEETADHPAGVSDVYFMDLGKIDKNTFEQAAFNAHIEQKQLEADKPDEDKALEAEKAVKAKEANQAPAEPVAPESAPETEAKDGSSETDK